MWSSTEESMERSQEEFQQPIHLQASVFEQMFKQIVNFGESQCESHFQNFLFFCPSEFTLSVVRLSVSMRLHLPQQTTLGQISTRLLFTLLVSEVIISPPYLDHASLYLLLLALTHHSQCHQKSRHIVNRKWIKIVKTIYSSCLIVRLLAILRNKTVLCLFYFLC